MNQRRSLIGWLSAVSLVPLFAVVLAALPGTPTQAATDYTLRATVGAPSGSPGALAGTSIIDVTPDDKYAVFVGKDDQGYRMRVIDLATDTFLSPSFNLSAALPEATLGLTDARASGVAVSPLSGGSYYAIVTLRENDTSLSTPGKLAYLSINAATGAVSLLAGAPQTTVGINPESVDIAANGQYAVVANEGALSGGVYTGGSISVVDLRAGATQYQVVQTVTPTVTNPQPETVAIAPNSQRAFVTLQTNNAVEIINMGVDVVTGGLIAAGTTFTFGETLRPDGIAVTGDSNYIVTANELALMQSVSLFQVSELTPGAPTLTAVGSKVVTTGFIPKMVAIGQVPGTAGEQAFVSLRKGSAGGDAIGVFNISPAGLTLTTTVVLDPPAATGLTADDPEGVAVAESRGLILTANAPARTVSIVAAADPAQLTPTITTTPTETTTPTTTPTTPTVEPLGWLPLVRK